MTQHTYLLINGLTILFPLILSFDKRVRFLSGWRGIIPAIVLPAILFISWDQWFAYTGVWSFNPAYLGGIYWGALPMEEWLFFVTVPYACLFIYACIRSYFPGFHAGSIKPWLLLGIFLLSLTLLLFFGGRNYTAVAFGLTLLCCLWLIYRKPQWESHFLLSYGISLVPFFVVNGLLTALPVVLYNTSEILNFRLGSIPFEDMFYHFCLFQLNVAIYERFKG